MAKLKIADISAQIVEILAPLSSDERRRVVEASLLLLGDEPNDTKKQGSTLSGSPGAATAFPHQAQSWIRQNGVTTEQLGEIFHFAGGAVEVMTPEIPGKGNKHKTISAYVLAGVAKFLLTGASDFGDKDARDLCVRLGCYNLANHAAYLHKKGNLFTGSKDGGWTLTGPGLRRGAEIIKALTERKK